MQKKFLSILMLSMTLLSCKKEETGSNEIVHQNLNIEIKATLSFLFDTIVLINFNKDTDNDFFLRMRYSESPRGINHDLFFASDDSRNQWLVYESGEDAIASLLNSNSKIDSTSSIWSGSGILYRKTLSENLTAAVGSGDVLVGIRFVIDSKYHYGWMKLFVSSDFKSVILKEVAYKIRPNVEIRAGEK